MPTHDIKELCCWQILRCLEVTAKGFVIFIKNSRKPEASGYCENYRERVCHFSNDVIKVSTL